jgi:hypothetical protein
VSNKLRHALIAFAIFLGIQLMTGGMSVAGLLIMFAFIGFVYLASRFPLFGSIGGGLLLLGSPLVAWLLYNPKFFQTDGSPAGLVLMLILVVVIFMLMSLGFSMLKVALFPEEKLSDDERADLAMKMMDDKWR